MSEYLKSFTCVNNDRESTSCCLYNPENVTLKQYRETKQKGLSLVNYVASPQIPLTTSVVGCQATLTHMSPTTAEIYNVITSAPDYSCKTFR